MLEKADMSFFKSQAILMLKKQSIAVIAIGAGKNGIVSRLT